VGASRASKVDPAAAPHRPAVRSIACFPNSHSRRERWVRVVRPQWGSWSGDGLCGRAGPAEVHPTWVLPVQTNVLTDRNRSHSLEPQVATMTCSKPLILPDTADYPLRLRARQQADQISRQATWPPKHQEVARTETVRMVWLGVSIGRV